MNFKKLFLKIKSKRNGQQSETLGKTLETLMTVKDQREEAIESLALMSAEIRVPQLMRRFKISIDHAIQDKKEKERIESILLETPEQIKPYLKQALKDYPQPSWILRLAQKTFPQEEYVKLLIGEINPDFVSFDDEVQEKNKQILLALKETQDPQILEHLDPFFESRDEDLRMTSFEVLEIFCEKKEAKALEKLNQIYEDMKKKPEDQDENPRIWQKIKSLKETT